MHFVFVDLQGHPQCRKNATMVGFPAVFGSLRRSCTGAGWPIAGGDDVLTLGGVSQEDSSCMVVILCERWCEEGCQGFLWAMAI